MIYSDSYEDDFLSSLDLFGRYLWMGLIVAVADDQGRMIDNAAIIRARVFPFDSITDGQVEAVIATLAAAGKVLRYQANGKKLIQIANWWKFQQPSWAAKSNFPAPEGWTDRIKMHVKGNKILSVNWEKAGGYEDSVDNGLPSQLCSALPSQQDSAIEEQEYESESKSKSEDKNKPESEPEFEPEAASVMVVAGGGAPLAGSGEKLTVENLKMLNRYGIGEPARSEILRLPNVNPAMIEYHCRNAPSVGAAIYRIRNGWEVGQTDAPRERDRERGYRREDYAQFIQR
jgi:hypothetical protein